MRCASETARGEQWKKMFPVTRQEKIEGRLRGKNARQMETEKIEKKRRVWCKEGQVKAEVESTLSRS